MITQEQAKTIGIIGLAGGIAFAGYKLLQKFGLVEDQDDKQAKKLDQLFAKWGSDQYFKDVAVAWISKYKRKPTNDEITNTTLAKVTSLAKQIYDSKGFFSDDEDKLYSNFRDLQSGTNYWRLNKFFRIKYQRSVLDYITGFTNAKERAIIYNIVKDLPDFVKTK